MNCAPFWAPSAFLGAQRIRKGGISKFIEEAVRWRIFRQTVREAREAFSSVPRTNSSR